MDAVQGAGRRCEPKLPRDLKSNCAPSSNGTAEVEQYQHFITSAFVTATVLLCQCACAVSTRRYMEQYSHFHIRFKNQAHVVEPHRALQKCSAVLGEIGTPDDNAPTFQLAITPGSHANHIPKGNLVYCTSCVKIKTQYYCRYAGVHAS